MSERTVLLVEPDSHFAHLLRASLEESGWHVEHTPSGRQALAKCAHEAPDVVVTEMDLEDLDGFELLEAIHALPSAPPAVICSHVPGARNWEAETLAAFGVKACIVRPTQLEAIHRAVERAARPKSAVAKKT